MCEDDGTIGGDVSAEAAQFGISGGGQLMIKRREAMREMIGRAHLSLGRV